MKVENILKVADAIEHLSVPGLGFNMGDYLGPASAITKDMSGHNCGTIACIAGWTFALRNEVKTPKSVETGDFETDPEADWLGLDDHTANMLFHGYSNSRAITNHHAAKVLRHLAATGEVDWYIA